MKRERLWLVIVALAFCGFVAWQIFAVKADPEAGSHAATSPLTVLGQGKAAGAPPIRSAAFAAEIAEPAQTRGAGLAFWQDRYQERLAGDSIWIYEKEDWWFDDQEVMQAFQLELALRLQSLQTVMDAEDMIPRPWKFPGLDPGSLAAEHPLGVVLTMENVDIPYLGHYEMTLVATELQHLSGMRKAHGLTPFASERPTISLAEMDSEPFAYPVEYFLQAYSGDDRRTDWPADILESSRRAWSDYIAEYALNQKDYLNREAAMSDAAQTLRILKPHPAYYDRLLPGTSQLAEQMKVVESAYLQSLRRIALSLGTPK